MKELENAFIKFLDANSESAFNLFDTISFDNTGYIIIEDFSSEEECDFVNAYNAWINSFDAIVALDPQKTFKNFVTKAVTSLDKYDVAQSDGKLIITRKPTDFKALQKLFKAPKLELIEPQKAYLTDEYGHTLASIKLTKDGKFEDAYFFTGLIDNMLHQ